MSTPIHFSISNFRSFKDGVTIELNGRFLIVTGQNNTGKTNILRAIALLYNTGYNFGAVLSDEADRFNSANDIRVTFFFDPRGSFANSASSRSALLQKVLSRFDERLAVPYLLRREGMILDMGSAQSFFGDLIPPDADGQISLDLHSSQGNRASNLERIVKSFECLQAISIGTIYVPSFRHITKPGSQLPSFNAMNLPGKTISPETIVFIFQHLDRPPAGKLKDKENLRRMRAFCRIASNSRRVSRSPLIRARYT